MAKTLIDFEIRESVKEAKKADRDTHTLGYIRNVDPRKRYGHAVAQYADVKSALSGYAGVKDFSAPAVAFLSDKSIDCDDSLFEFIAEKIASVTVSPEHYFIPVPQRIVDNGKLYPNKEGRKAMDDYNSAIKSIRAAEIVIAGIPDKIKSLETKKRTIKRQYHDVIEDYCYYIDVWQRCAEIDCEISEMLNDIDIQRDTINNAYDTIASIELQRFYVIDDIHNITKRGDYPLVGYRVWDTKRNCTFTVKTSYNDALTIPTNTYTHKIIADLMIEPEMVQYMHRLKMFDYSFKFRRIAKTEIKAA